jgi:hypothetical protein
MIGLASKSTTTWFLGGRDGTVAEFIKFHFETANAPQLTYTANGNSCRGLAWYISTAYIVSASNAGS